MQGPHLWPSSPSPETEVVSNSARQCSTSLASSWRRLDTTARRRRSCRRSTSLAMAQKSRKSAKILADFCTDLQTEESNCSCTKFLYKFEKIFLFHVSLLLMSIFLKKIIYLFHRSINSCVDCCCYCHSFKGLTCYRFATSTYLHILMIRTVLNLFIDRNLDLDIWARSWSDDRLWPIHRKHFLLQQLGTALLCTRYVSVRWKIWSTEENFLLKIVSFPASYFNILVLSTQLKLDRIANDWISTADIWCQKWPHYQLHHNDCPCHYLIVWVKLFTIKNYSMHQMVHLNFGFI